MLPFLTNATPERRRDYRAYLLLFLASAFYGVAQSDVGEYQTIIRQSWRLRQWILVQLAIIGAVSLTILLLKWKDLYGRLFR